MDNRHHLVRVACLATVLAAGCTTGTADPGAGPAPRVDAMKLDASVTQHRYAEGTRDLLAGVINNFDRAVGISSATIRWAGLDFPTVAAEEPVPPGQTGAFTVRYGAPRCDVRAPGPPTLVTVLDGAEVVLRLADGRPRLPVPVMVRCAGRCDPHSRSQSSQTFLFSVYVHRDSEDVLRLVQVPAAAEQQRPLSMLDRVCR